MRNLSAPAPRNRGAGPGNNVGLEIGFYVIVGGQSARLHE